ncbi:hypothetical protein OPV22_001162 [Ensete ventricosum]|uniref:Uncharacterized protein n=1 Tax=Ensete ventricosum TaxID=4639 RepID=A0AAV8RUC2_ENSVE|nr:hypothetical protein OPV22_001162 [Ensete ventricosum]
MRRLPPPRVFSAPPLLDQSFPFLVVLWFLPGPQEWFALRPQPTKDLSQEWHPLRRDPPLFAAFIARKKIFDCEQTELPQPPRPGRDPRAPFQVAEDLHGRTKRRWVEECHGAEDVHW